jgi:hypothetical protein
LAKTCQADVDALHRLLRALANIRVMEETRRDIFGHWSLPIASGRASLPHGCVIRKHLLGGHRSLKVTQSFVPRSATALAWEGSHARTRSKCVDEYMIAKSLVEPILHIIRQS